MAIIYFQVFNQVALPTTGVTVPAQSWGFDDSGPLHLSRSDLAGTGLRFDTALNWAISSTPGVYTDPSATHPAAVVNLQITPP